MKMIGASRRPFLFCYKGADCLYPFPTGKGETNTTFFRLSYVPFTEVTLHCLVRLDMTLNDTVNIKSRKLSHNIKILSAKQY